MTTKSLEKQLRKLRKAEKKRIKKAKLKREIWILKHGKLLRTGEKVRTGLGRLGKGSKTVWKKMKEMEEKEARRTKKRKGSSQEDYATRINKLFS